MNSTPFSPTSTMRFTALPPPPPTPTTLIFAPRRASGSSVSRSLSASRPSSLLMPDLPYSRPLEEFLEDAPQPDGYATKCPGAPTRRFGRPIAMRIQHQPYRRRKHRTVHVIGEP